MPSLSFCSTRVKVTKRTTSRKNRDLSVRFRIDASPRRRNSEVPGIVLLTLLLHDCIGKSRPPHKQETLPKIPVGNRNRVVVIMGEPCTGLGFPTRRWVGSAQEPPSGRQDQNIRHKVRRRCCIIHHIEYPHRAQHELEHQAEHHAEHQPNLTLNCLRRKPDHLKYEMLGSPCIPIYQELPVIRRTGKITNYYLRI